MNVLAALRAPCARSARLLYPFSAAGNFNPGFTLQFPDGEPAVAPGSGTVTAITRGRPYWSHPPSSILARSLPWQIVIDHGQNVGSAVHGLAEVEVRVGQAIARGTRLGTVLAEVFFAILQNGKAVDPSKVNPHFIAQNDSRVPGEGGRLRAAPDLIERDLTGGTVTYMKNNLRYFFRN